MSIQLPDFSAARVSIAGDVMLDRNWHGGTHRISPEAPVPVVHIHGDDDLPGGAANVALNVAALGARVELMGVVGDDDPATALSSVLEQRGVSTQLLRRPGLATITKLRILSRHQQLLRVDFEDKPAGYAAPEFGEMFQQSQADVLVLSDYAKGALSDPQALIAAARIRNTPIVVDPKGSDFARYRGASVVTPNMSEFQAVVGECETEAQIEAKARQLAIDCELDALLITRSEHGMSLVPRSGEVVHLPTHALEVFDVTGAGDTVVATLASALASGSTLADAMRLANLAAGLVVAKAGTATVSNTELQRAVAPLVAHRGVMNVDSLVAAVQQAKAAGETVVMTNGCFDILHAGHVQYLEQARALGDRLIVAVNSDESVERLKGPERPFNKLADRMAVLAGLASVDWVVPFAEDTPAELIGAALPNVLVKGGDYKPEQIAGAEAVWENGGRVEVLSFLEGRSTSGLVDKVRSQ